MRWKKPKWVQNIQKKADDIVKPITTSTPVKAVQRAATNTFVKPIQQIAKKLPPPPPKPKVVQQVQKAAQKTADKVGQGAKDVAKQTGQAINKAADKVGDVVRPAAQSVAKEVGHMVNPAIGEVALRGKQIAKASTPVLKRIGDKLGDAGRVAGDALLDGYTRLNPMRSGSGGRGLNLAGEDESVGQNTSSRGRFLPFFTKILPDTLSDTAKGILRTGKGLVTLDGDEIVSGIKRTGRGVGDTLKHTGLGGLEVLSAGFNKRPGDTIDGSGAGGQGPTQNRNPQEKSQPPVVVSPTEEAESPGILTSIQEGAEKAGRTLKDLFSEGNDQTGTNSRTFYYKYSTVSTEAERDAFTDAYRRGDKAEMDRIIQIMENRKRNQ